MCRNTHGKGEKMRIHIVARHIELTSALRNFVEERLNKFQHYFENITWVQAILEVEKNTHYAEIVVHAGRHTIRAKGSSNDMYVALDKAADKIDVQLKKYKGKLKGISKSEIDAFKISEIYSVLPSTRISVVKEVSVKPMTQEDAAVEMDKLGYTFWMFMDKKTRQLNVIFKRLDNSYGILQPVKKA